VLTKRLIACLDVRAGRVVKGVRFKDLRDVGDPVDLAQRYEDEGADEIVFLDVSATTEDRSAMLSVAEKTADTLFIPLTIGGGMKTIEDMGRALRAGADKVAVNSAAVARPALLTEAAALFGAQCVVVSIDAQREGEGWKIFTHSGGQPARWEAVDWALECAKRGAGELLVTSIDRDGRRTGYDLALIDQIAKSVRCPVIASGGAGSGDDVVEVLQATSADAALVAGILHDGVTTVGKIKEAMLAAGLPVRVAA